MVSVGIALIIESILVVALCFCATYALHASHISKEITDGMSYFYPLSTFQSSTLIFLIISLLGIFLVAASGTKGLKWFMVPLFIFCLPSIISRSGIPEFLRENYMIELTDISVLSTDISMQVLLLLCILLVAGFILLHQLVSLREMYQQLTAQGVDKYDIVIIYRARILLTVIVLLVAAGISYVLIGYSSDLKTAISESTDFTPLASLAACILCASVAIAILCKILLFNKPRLEVDKIEPEKGVRAKFTNEAKSITAIAIPTSASNVLAKLAKRTMRIIAKPGYHILKMKPFNYLKSGILKNVRFRWS